ncbi:uncharacterized protein LOC114961204 [Acropora millepora]|uniref:uncharacterized protein LOC114961204 n=1 Tax=Acropora millepora TaxID=45264 RepID=UPI001CF10AE3|nr:uncharacterized protein LOC114961204 [Acropora millepora]XP_029195656.2 uncharacterized protein LOC114961204 [Acropora millepora]XP_029195657.2 uncharacterized protein LOC114961204 [Acropora millepora]XP_029195658.2 uncharacterized protein LOC114961204 [Acropora millepora]
MAFRVFRKRFVLPAIAVTLICITYFFFGHYTRNSGTITRISTPVPSVENVAIASIKSNAFLAATMINKGKLYPSAVCVVDPAIIECIGMGFAAFLLMTLDLIRFCGFLGIHRPVVYWRACDVVCSRNPRVNSWNWYFEPVNPGLEIQVEKVLCIILPNEDFGGKLISVLDSSFRNRSMMKAYEHSTIVTDRERKQVNQLMNQYVTPNSRIKEKVRVFYDRHLAGFNLLGVHVRGTDHWRETPEQKLPPLLSWVNKAAEILETLPHPRKVFIASDNDEVIKNFVEFFGKEKVAFIDAVRAKRYHSQIPPHDIKFSTDSYARAVGTQVLMDILLLARCEHFLHAESSVALLASYFNPNMRSYFLDPDKTFLKGKKQDHKRNAQNKELNARKLHTADFLQDWDEKLTEDREMTQCFLKIHKTNTCLNTTKGILVDLEGTRRFLKGH